MEGKNGFTRSLPFKLIVALAFSMMLGLAAAWNKSRYIANILEEFQKIVLSIVTKIVIPVLPVLIGATFAVLAYEGSITRQLPIFLIVILIVMAGHYLWMALLYGLAGAYSGRSSARGGVQARGLVV